MDTVFNAVPRIQRIPLRVIDVEAIDPNNTEVEETPTKTQIFIGYEKGPGCPVPIALEVDRIQDEYEEEYPSSEERTTMGLSKYVTRARRANTLLRRNLLLAVIRDLDITQADILAATDDDGNGEGVRILRRLGWMDTPIETETDTETDTATVENTEEGEVEKGDANGESN